METSGWDGHKPLQLAGQRYCPRCLELVQPRQVVGGRVYIEYRGVFYRRCGIIHQTTGQQCRGRVVSDDCCAQHVDAPY
jgi:hypothetical protein